MRRFLLAIALLIAAFGSPTQAQFSGGGGATAPLPPLSASKMQAACENGNAQDCDDLGVRYLKGDGVEKDAKKAATLFQRACNGGDAVGCFDIAESYRFGDGVAKDIKAAGTRYLRACDGRYASACAELAILYSNGDGLIEDDAKTALYADRACKGGAQLGCAILGAVYVQGTTGYPKDRRRAEDLLSQACFKDADFKVAPDRTSSVSCPLLAKLIGKPACYRNTYPGGPSVDTCFEAPRAWKVTTIPAQPDPPAAAVAAPPRVDPVAASNSAVNAGNAAYARKDYAVAASRFATACDAGNPSACGKLGTMFLKGEGVGANSMRAAAAFAKACDGRIAASCDSLGLLYDNGSGVSLNKKQALALYAKACAGGFQDACNRPLQTGGPTEQIKKPQQVAASSNMDRPASANQARLLANAIRQDSYNWMANEYDNGSLREVKIVELKDGVVTVRGDYTYNNGSSGWVAAQIKGESVQCLQYWDTNFCADVRPTPYYIKNPPEDKDCYYISSIRSERTYDYTYAPGDGHWSGGNVIARELTNNCGKPIFVRDDSDGKLKYTVKPGQKINIGTSDIVRMK